MNRLLDELRQQGITLFLGEDGSSLRFKAAREAMTSQIQEQIKVNKEVLIAYLVQEQKREEAFNSFKERHGLDLLEYSWDRVAVFGGLDPMAADELPGVLAILMDGYELVHIQLKYLLFQRGNNFLSWMREGHFLGGEYMKTTLKRLEKK